MEYVKIRDTAQSVWAAGRPEMSTTDLQQKYAIFVKEQ
jgi:hypothetical protein